ncbi:hypothetical protein IMG5_130770 [Ichthyophthirius multifiliis]|uniref:RNA helicase n=1 Tax=Ichthyophthirius multifiliis TaxID=5932 RepID=G0QWB3_ICHMU|nr:hypothetical protein IMG5_130770 [Ichthyophthirius multifiliis]EGR30485.1 hypothetical protein IMG5_130770 [Ichthyophthirius multifiliis]|eukprot:XP_004032072.1 hypothetical protein IMG5_130770 [Ichthyophthirius multifiliis]
MKDQKLVKNWQEQRNQKKQEKEQEILLGEGNNILAYDQYNFDELPIQKHSIKQQKNIYKTKKNKEQEILYCVENYSCVIVIAETGSGKTTKIPQYLFEAGYGINNKKICISLPRRIAAISIANRVAQEMNCKIGEEVGYSVRFDEKTDDDLTQIKYMTDGMLINEIQKDPLLTQYSVIMIDDIHERTINTDIILALLKKIRRKNPVLKFVISSATLEGKKIFSFFQENQFQAKILNISGRLFPVDIFYLQESCQNYVLQALFTTLDIIYNKKEGDVLVFLTSQQEIEAFMEILYNRLTEKPAKVKILPLYSGLPQEEQLEVFKPVDNNTRKIIISTNIAESSITIQGIVYVIDCLHQKINYFDYKKGIDNLQVIPISKQSAKQRAGRAGRVQKGECYRLCKKEDFEKILYNENTPEILRCKLTDFIIQIKNLGVGDISQFELLTKPKEEAFAKSLEELFAFQIINKDCNLNDLGKQVVEFQLPYNLSVLLLNSFQEEFGCSEEILALCSILCLQGQVFYSQNEVQNILKVKKKIGAKEGDHLTLINIFLLYKNIKNQNGKNGFCNENKINSKSLHLALKIYDQLKEKCTFLGYKIVSGASDIEGILRCLVKAFFLNVGQLQPDGSYRNLRNKEILFLHPSSILNIKPPQWVVYSDLVFTSKYYMREVSEIEASWLLELAGHYFIDVRAKQMEKKHQEEIQVLNKQEKYGKGFDIGFKKKKGMDFSVKKQQDDEVKKKIKLNLPIKKEKQNNILSFIGYEEQD